MCTNSPSSQFEYKMKIVIIGGGLGGFAVGIGLLQYGFDDVTIYERDSSIDSRRQGYGLTILQGITALKKFNVFNEVQSLDTPSRSHYIFEKSGKLIGFFGTIFWPEDNHTNQPKSRKKYNLHSQRQELRRILFNRYISLHQNGSNGVQWNYRLQTIDRIQRQIIFTNGELLNNVDLVIGADGINGIVRSFKYNANNDLPLNYLGILVVLGITKSNEHFLTKDRVFQTMDGSFRLFAMPFSKFNPDQSIMWQLSFPCQFDFANYLSKNPKELKEYLLDKCGDWHSPIPQMIKDTQIDLLMGIVAFDRDVQAVEDLQKNDLSIALIGDAAHPMSPFKGQGANQALLDAMDLSDIIHQCQSDLCLAMQIYEDKMLKRVHSKVLQSRERVTTFHQSEILSTESFLYRGIDQDFIDQLNQMNFNAQWNDESLSIEQAIINELASKKLNTC